MSESVTDQKGGMEMGIDLIRGGYHDVKSNGRYFISVVKIIAEVVEVDPTEERLYVEDCIEPFAINALARGDAKTCARLGFDYGDYRVTVCSCGDIQVYGDVELHERGLTKTPTSMR